MSVYLLQKLDCGLLRAAGCCKLLAGYGRRAAGCGLLRAAGGYWRLTAGCGWPAGYWLLRVAGCGLLLAVEMRRDDETLATSAARCGSIGGVVRVVSVLVASAARCGSIGGAVTTDE